MAGKKITRKTPRGAKKVSKTATKKAAGKTVAATTPRAKSRQVRKKQAAKKTTRKKVVAIKPAGKATRGAVATSTTRNKAAFRHCSVPHVAPRELPCGANINREALIRVADNKWVNGTRLHYYFFTNSGWRGTSAEQRVVRQAFEMWKDLDIGLEFAEVDTPDEAEIRIGFQRGDGTWSYLGRDVLEQGQTSRTMNYGWNISNDLDTALHEIGHTLGFPHEHQNPNAGIEWDEQAVYSALAGAPNFWSRDITYWNIIRKLPRAEVEGSEWDKDSIMHYPFEAGMILAPEGFRTQPLIPAPGLSARDEEWAKVFYPPLQPDDHSDLRPFESVSLSLGPGEQANFVIRPSATRWYQFATFGDSDSVMVLFEEIDGQPRYRAGDDDSGEDFNAWFEERLFAGRTYILRVRLYWQNRSGDFAVMMW